MYCSFCCRKGLLLLLQATLPVDSLDDRCWIWTQNFLLTKGNPRFCFQCIGIFKREPFLPVIKQQQRAWLDKIQGINCANLTNCAILKYTDVQGLLGEEKATGLNMEEKMCFFLALDELQICKKKENNFSHIHLWRGKRFKYAITVKSSKF